MNKDKIVHIAENLFEEAVKMVVCAIGYANYSPEGIEWYSKYMTTASTLGVLKNVDGVLNTAATRKHNGTTIVYGDSQPVLNLYQ